MDGIINALKPPGMTSHDMVNWFRRRLGTKRIGHLGTLDPAAAGVLPLCVGKATRLVEYMSDWDKEYRAEMVLGLVTDSQDTSGNIKSRQTGIDLNEDEIIRTIQGMAGTRRQVPPMVSAVKYQGRRLYELARKGREIEPPSRDITIYNVNVLRVYRRNGFYRAVFDASVSKGTYIRTICHDIGQKLGCGGTLAFLIRTRVGPFSLSDSWLMEEVGREIEDESFNFLLPSDMGIKEWPVLILTEAGTFRIQNGGYIGQEHVAQGESVAEGARVRLLDTAGQLAAVGQVRKLEGKMICHPNKVFIQ